LQRDSPACRGPGPCTQGKHAATRGDRGRSPKEFGAGQIVARVLYRSFIASMVNESSAITKDGVVSYTKITFKYRLATYVKDPSIGSRSSEEMAIGDVSLHISGSL